MSAQEISAAHEAAVIIDLESISGIPTKKEQYHSEELGRIIKGIFRTLRSQGFAPNNCWGVARAFRSKKDKKTKRSYLLSSVGAERQISFSLALEKYGVTVSWCKDVIADRALIREVEQRFSERSLPKGVVFVTTDTDFVPLAKKLATAGHVVFVAGWTHNIGIKWREVASVISLHSILGMAEKIPLPNKKPNSGR